MGRFDEKDLKNAGTEDKMAAYIREQEQEIQILRQQVKEYGKDINHVAQMLELQQEWMDSENNKPRKVVHEMDEKQFKDLEERLHSMDNRLTVLEDLIERELTIGIPEKLDELYEKTHTDCIKVYRNVQAVIVEENAKQNKLLVRMDGRIGKSKNRITSAFICSIISAIVTVILIILVILPAFGIKLL